MHRVFSHLFGPELYWIIVYALVRLAGRRHLPPDPAITSWLDARWALIPYVIVPLTFLLFLVPGPNRWWLLLRIDLAIAVGVVVVATHFCESMVYHKPASGPGAGTGWILMIIFGYFFAFVGTFIAAGVLWWRTRR